MGDIRLRAPLRSFDNWSAVARNEGEATVGFPRDIVNWMVFSAGRSTTDLWVMDRLGRLSVSHRASTPETKQWRYLTFHPNRLGPRKLTRRQCLVFVV